MISVPTLKAILEEHNLVTRRGVGKSTVEGGIVLLAGLGGTATPAAQGIDIGSNGVANLKTFGAVGDGQHDDTIAIRTAVMYCSVSSCSLYIPAGIYVITDSIEIDTSVGFTIFGDGYASCLQPRAGGTYIPIFVGSAKLAPINGMHLRSFRIDANGTGQLDTGVVTLNNVIGGSISQMWIENGTRRSGSSGQNGISSSMGEVHGAGPELIITQNVIRNFSKAGINFTSGGARAIITANLIREIKGNGTAPGIQINGGRNAIVAHNHITETEGSGILVTSDKQDNPSFSANISHNIIERCGLSSESQGDGILIASQKPSSSYLLVEGNQVYNNGAPRNGGCGIRVINCDNAIISGNACHHNSFDGIRTEHCGFLQIVGNHCSDNNVAGVKFAGGIHLRGYGRHINATGNHLASNGLTQSYGIISDVDSVLTSVSISGNHAAGNSEGSVFWQAKGRANDIEFTIQHNTTDGSPNAVLLWRLDPDSTCWVSLAITARLNGTTRSAIYIREVVYSFDGSSIEQRDVTRSTDSLGSLPVGGVSFSSSKGFAVVSVAGDASSNVEWGGTVRVRSF